MFGEIRDPVANAEQTNRRIATVHRRGDVERCIVPIGARGQDRSVERALVFGNAVPL